MSLKFQIPRRKRSDEVVEQIKAWIVSEGHRPGDRLPQEKDLIDAFNVSRGTIREALKSLEVQGLIRINTGPSGGAAVAAVPYEVAANLLGNYFFFQNLNPESIYLVRKLLEPELVAVAMPHLSRDQIARLEETVKICRPAPTSPDEQHRQRLAELEFHDILADACPNPFLKFQCKFINDFLSNMVSYKKMYDEDQEQIRIENIIQHEKIIQFIKMGKQAEARAEMSAHMNGCECHLQQMEAVVARRFLGRGIPYGPMVALEAG